MKAIVLNEYGGPNKLTLQEIAEPRPAPGEIKVKVAAAGLNPIDWKLRSGGIRAFMPIEFPHVLGRDASGEVVEVGSGVTQFKVGDEVMGTVQRGYAEFVTGPASAFTAVPAGLDVRDAAAIPVVALTGTQLIEETLNVQRGQTVLVTGAMGGVGRFALYAAKARGAKAIAGVRTSQLARAQKLGASTVVALDDDSALAGLPPLDAVADAIGGATLAKVTRRVKNGGVVASTLGPPPGDGARGVQGKGMQVHADGTRLAGLAQAISAGEVELPIAKRFPLQEAGKAHQFAEAGAGGKVLLTL